MGKFNNREVKIMSITLAVWGLFLFISGVVMKTTTKPIIETKYSLNIEKRKIAETQAKTNEIKIKDIEIEVNNPISVDVKDYLLEVENLSDETIKALKLDTSLVNINEAGTYQYKITYKKKTYIGNVIVKAKKLPEVTFTLKTIKLKTKDAISSNPRSFINETISDDVYNNITLDISKVDTSVQGDYVYYIIYNGITYQGNVEVRDPGPTIITPSDNDDNNGDNNNNNNNNNTITCPEDAKEENGTCVCNNLFKTYDPETKTCK